MPADPKHVVNRLLSEETGLSSCTFSRGMRFITARCYPTAMTPVGITVDTLVDAQEQLFQKISAAGLESRRETTVACNRNGVALEVSLDNTDEVAQKLLAAGFKESRG